MQYTNDFKKLVRKTLRKAQTCKNYIYRLESMSLTEGFWWNHGDKLSEYLNELQNNYTDQWKSYCEEEGICWDATVLDWVC